MSKELAELNEQEAKFVELLFENKGNIHKAAEEAGFNPHYGYKLRVRLAKAITEAAEQYLSVNSMKAAVKLVDSIDNPMPNPVNVSAAAAVLDRVGIIKKDPRDGQQVIKANIFILPEKRFAEVLDNRDTMIDVTPNV
jgi:hypothetical protein